MMPPLSPRAAGHPTGRPGRILVIAVAIAAMLLLSRSSAHAEAEQIACSFLEIKASNDDSGIDPRLRPLGKKLTRPPLSSWKSFKLVAKHDRKLALMKSQDVSLQAGGKLSALYRQHTRPAGKKNRFSLDLSLDDRSGKRTLDTKIGVDEGDYFVIAHSPSQDSSDLLALTCKVN